MNRVRVLDCTLRDGGYCNQWRFGYENVKKIINGLVKSGINIVECGFLTNKVEYQENRTKFTTMDEVAEVLPKNRSEKLFVCLMNYGEYNLEDIPPYDGTSLDGIRVAFHKKDMSKALEFCEGIKKKGYKVFVQAMVSLNYSDEEYLELIKRTNIIAPYAFYIVDSFGVMKGKDLTRLFYIVEHNLTESIYIGYHSHNNMQLAYSNAQSLVSIQTKRKLIIDASIFGMGRGAGNLNTELFVEFLNDTEGTEYKLQPLLTLIDEILNKFYQENYWGYSLPNYLSASHNAHPNYASYLNDKQTLTIEDMDAIFSMMSNEKKASFDKEYIEALYTNYMANGKSYEEHIVELKKTLFGKKILIIAPGKSSEVEKAKIIQFAEQHDVVSISINFDYNYLYTDFIFLSNLRRYRELNKSKRYKCIVTSNIPAENIYIKTKYGQLLNDVEAVRDNAGMMLIQFLINLGVKDIIIAGIDGYSHEVSENYADEQMALITKNAILDAMNTGMTNLLTRFANKVKITFLTGPRRVTIANLDLLDNI
ncbi:hypothetical protein [Sporolactobacillus spathodeae]|uniref:4-hydroxy 2-oxovalerate aldolase n=1 Tax=Sporolactobacillus spathodeae TaxID=1465502 RepID=A0ABS2Q7I0_9BACL|nr:hypothetical protein [Sporolactobacillus spathodeae]MBM7657749.1 4-hydroxy 2-oxovalerate aldolase [Sporolactobacillus spathodeae]